MHIRDLQNTIKQRDPYPDTREQTFFKLMESVGGLAEALRTDTRYQTSDPTLRGTSHGGTSHGGIIDEELYNVLYAVFMLANLHNIDIEQAITLKEQLNQLRQMPTTISAASAIAEDADLHSLQEFPMPSTPKIDLKPIALRYIDELWNQRNLAVADELFADDCVTNQLRSGAAPNQRAAPT